MTQRMIWKFEGKPVDTLGWWDLIRYNAALSRSEHGLSGSLDGAKLTRNGITVEYEQTPADTATQTDNSWESNW